MARPNFLRHTIDVSTKEELHNLLEELKENEVKAGIIKVSAKLDWPYKDYSESRYNQMHDDYVNQFKAVGVPLKIAWYQKSEMERHPDDLDFGLEPSPVKQNDLKDLIKIGENISPYIKSDDFNADWLLRESERAKERASEAQKMAQAKQKAISLIEKHGDKINEIVKGINLMGSFQTIQNPDVFKPDMDKIIDGINEKLEKQYKSDASLLVNPYFYSYMQVKDNALTVLPPETVSANELNEIKLLCENIGTIEKAVADSLQAEISRMKKNYDFAIEDVLAFAERNEYKAKVEKTIEAINNIDMSFDSLKKEPEKQSSVLDSLIDAAGPAEKAGEKEAQAPSKEDDVR